MLSKYFLIIYVLFRFLNSTIANTKNVLKLCSYLHSCNLIEKQKLVITAKRFKIKNEIFFVNKYHYAGILRMYYKLIFLENVYIYIYVYECLLKGSDWAK